jgi:hypothetical protein
VWWALGRSPAYAGTPNSVQLRLSDSTEEPILELEERMNAEVRFGEERVQLEMEPRCVPGVFGDPGDYRANFVPTRAGPVHLPLHRHDQRQQIDDEFTSAPETFSDVNDPAALWNPACGFRPVRRAPDG